MRSTNLMFKAGIKAGRGLGQRSWPIGIGAVVLASLGLTLSVHLAFFSAPVWASSHEVKIGVLYPLSGPSAEAGKAVLAAVRTAQDVVNNVHGADLPLAQVQGLPNLGGAKIRLVVADTAGDPEQGRLAAERLILEEGVAALYGAYHSSVTEAASAVAERLKIPFVTGESSSPSLHRRGFKWFF